MDWGTFRAQIRRFLNDETVDKYRWTDAMLLDYMCWALDALCSHTAVATATGFEVTVPTKQFLLPDNVYEPVNLSGAVYYSRAENLTYINPVKFNRITKLGATNSYYLLPDNQINLNAELEVGDILNVLYFASYPYPADDTDAILAPSWARAALTYKVGAHAFSPYGGRSAQIRQWGQRPDTGNPEDNPLKEQSAWYLRMWDLELNAVPRQDRRNYFKG